MNAAEEAAFLRGLTIVAGATPERAASADFLATRPGYEAPAVVSRPFWRARVACWYAIRLGLAVLPFAAAGGRKRPLIAGGCHSASHDADQIEAWWRRWPDAVIAAATGSVSGIVVLDLDRKGAKNALTEMRARGWTLPHTWTATTPSGGLHCYFRPFEAPGGVIRSATEMLGRGRSGVDLRGDGGAIILPTPRMGWRWTQFRPGRCDLAAAPGWLVRLVHDRQRQTPAPAGAARWHPRPGAIEAALRAIELAAPGSRQSTLAREAWRIGRLAREQNTNASATLAAVLAAARAIGGADWDRREAERTARRCFARGARDA